MRIRMLESCKGSPDGVQIRDYPKGWEGEVPADLAHCFLTDGVAEPAPAQGERAAAGAAEATPAPARRKVSEPRRRKQKGS